MKQRKNLPGQMPLFVDSPIDHLNEGFKPDPLLEVMEELTEGRSVVVFHEVSDQWQIMNRIHGDIRRRGLAVTASSSMHIRLWSGAFVVLIVDDKPRISKLGVVN